MRTFFVDVPIAKFLGRRKLAGLQERDQVVEVFERILDGGGAEQEQELTRQSVDRLPGLRGAIAQVMGLVDHQQVPVHRLRQRQMGRLLERMERGDQADALLPKSRRVGAERRLIRGEGVQMKLLLQLLFPLVHQRGHGEHEKAFDHAARQVFLDDQAGFDRFAQAHFIRRARLARARDR